MAIFDEVINLLIGIAWPVTVLLLAFFLRREIRATVVMLRDRIASANTGELNAGPVSVRWSGVIAAASTTILQLPVAEIETAAETRPVAKLPTVSTSITPVKSVIDAYETVLASLLAMPAPVPDQPDMLVGADAGTIARALSRAGTLDSQIANGVQVLTDLRDLMLSAARPTVDEDNAREYVTLAEAVLARLPTMSAEA